MPISRTSIRTKSNALMLPGSGMWFQLADEHQRHDQQRVRANSGEWESLSITHDEAAADGVDPAGDRPGTGRIPARSLKFSISRMPTNAVASEVTNGQQLQRLLRTPGDAGITTTPTIGRNVTRISPSRSGTVSWNLVLPLISRDEHDEHAGQDCGSRGEQGCVPLDVTAGDADGTPPVAARDRTGTADRPSDYGLVIDAVVDPPSARAELPRPTPLTTPSMTFFVHPAAVGESALTQPVMTSVYSQSKAVICGSVGSEEPGGGCARLKPCRRRTRLPAKWVAST